MPVPVTDSFTTSLIGTIEQLHKPHTSFQQPPGQNTVSGVIGLQSICSIVRAVGPQSRFGLTADVRNSRNTELHTGGQFVAGDPRLPVPYHPETAADDARSAAAEIGESADHADL